MDAEQMLLLEEVAEFQARLEQHPVATADVMQLSTLQVIEDVFPVGSSAAPLTRSCVAVGSTVSQCPAVC